MSYARHLMPQVGRLLPGVWHATAFGGHGMNTSTAAGLGLGLHICQQIAEAHGGRVLLANRDGGGLAVTMILPGS